MSDFDNNLQVSILQQMAEQAASLRERGLRFLFNIDASADYELQPDEEPGPPRNNDGVPLEQAEPGVVSIYGLPRR